MKDVVLSSSTVDMEIALKTVAEYERRVYQQLDIIREKILGEEGQALEKQTRELFVNWKPIREEVVQLVKSDNRDAIIITKEKGADYVPKFQAKCVHYTNYTASH